MVLAIQTVGSGIWARPLARPTWARDRQMISVKAIWRKHGTFAETGRGRDPSLKRKTAWRKDAMDYQCLHLNAWVQLCLQFRFLSYKR